MDPQASNRLEANLFQLGLTLDLAAPLTELDERRPQLAVLSQRDVGIIGEVGVFYSPAMTATHIDRLSTGYLDPSIPTFVLGDRVGAKSAEKFRSSGVFFLDQAGNAYLKAAGLLIDVRGRKPVATPERGLTGQVNLFSTKRAQVIFALLSWPALIDESVRTIAAVSGVSVGSVQETLEVLQHAGYLDDWSKRSLARKDELLERWVRAYPFGLGSTSRERAFNGDVHSFEATSDVYVSGEAAVDGLTHRTLILYTNEGLPRLALANRWRTDREPNIFIRNRFWRDPTQHSQTGRVRSAPPLLVYADLLAADESRQREAAEELRSRNPELRAM